MTVEKPLQSEDVRKEDTGWQENELHAFTGYEREAVHPPPPLYHSFEKGYSKLSKLYTILKEILLRLR